MKTHLKNTIVPHEGNDYKPHLLRQTGVLVVVVISIAVFVFGYLQRTLLFTDRMLATIYPTLVATLSNQNREQVALPALKYNPLLEEAARLKAEDMKIRGYFAHVSPDGLEPWDFIKKAGYNYEYAGENLAINFSDSADVTRAWMDSPTHRANILNNHYTEVGVATVKGYVEGRETVFVVQMFGSPARDIIAFEEVSTTTPVASSTVDVASSTVTVNSTTSTPIPDEQIPGEVLGVTANAVSDQTIQGAGIFTAISILLSNPRMILLSVYWVLSLAVLLSISLLLIFFKKHHIPHILYGLTIIVWIIACALVYVHFFGPEVLL